MIREECGWVGGREIERDRETEREREREVRLRMNVTYPSVLSLLLSDYF
jgi:hypothetical protein